MEWQSEYESMITRMAAAAYTHEQIAFALCLDVTGFNEWMCNDAHPASVAFYKGFYSSELTVRESVFQLARSGSSPAQTLAVKLIDETRKSIKRAGFNEKI